MSRFSAETFLSHSTETFRRGTFCAVFQKVSGSEQVYGWERERGGGGEGGSITIFCRKFFVSQFRKIS